MPKFWEMLWQKRAVKDFNDWKMAELRNKSARTSEENRTFVVFLLSLAMMAAEIAVGLMCNSMAMIANGVHMASHVAIIGLSLGAYCFIRHLNVEGKTTFDKEKIINLAAYTSGLTLLAVAIVVIVESVERLSVKVVADPTDSAVAIAVVGLVVNVVCALILHSKHNDVNVQAAFLHVVSDVIADLGVVASLVLVRCFNIFWIDIAVALISSLVIVRWAVKLLLKTGNALIRI